MKHMAYPKRDAIKNYFPLPNEIFMLGLCAGEISVYSYLLYRENRETYQCWPSYKTIGKAVNMSQNTVWKYVMGLEEKGLIVTEPTSIRTQSGQKRNGSLLYTIRPIQEALDQFYERQMAQMETAAAKQLATAKLAAVSPRGPLCGALEGEASTSPSEDKTGEIGPLWNEVRGTKGEAGESAGVADAPRHGHNRPQCGRFQDGERGVPVKRKIAPVGL